MRAMSPVSNHLPSNSSRVMSSRLAYPANRNGPVTCSRPSVSGRQDGAVDVDDPDPHPGQRVAVALDDLLLGVAGDAEGDQGVLGLPPAADHGQLGPPLPGLPDDGRRDRSAEAAEEPQGGEVAGKTTTTAAASRPNESDLLPLSTQSSPSRTARNCGIPASEPACGSVSPIPTISAPLQILGTQCAATSGAAFAATICPTSEPTTCR